MRNLRVFAASLVLLLGAASATAGEKVTWVFDLGPGDKCGVIGDDAHLIVRFSSDDIRVVVDGTDFTIVQRWVTDFLLVVGGTTYRPGEPRNPGEPPGVIAQERFLDWGPEQGDRETVVFDFDVEGGRQLILGLSSMSGYGQPSLLKEDVFSVAAPFGFVSGSGISSQLVVFDPSVPTTDYCGEVEYWAGSSRR